VTEKMDGESCSMYSDGCHARSMDSKDHWTRSRVKKIHGEKIGWVLQASSELHRICGENMQGKHSIYYSSLPDYYIAFSVWDKRNFCIDWDATEELLKYIGIASAPVLYRGPWDEEKIKACYTGESVCGGIQEGYVVRTVEGFHFDDFSTHVGKYVRKGHVQTGEFWMKTCDTENGVVKC
jgi:hypothetical protein